MGKNRLENQANNKLGLGGNVVIRLVDAACIPSNAGHKVFFDNYFTSISLMEQLLEKGGACIRNLSLK